MNYKAAALASNPELFETSPDHDVHGFRFVLIYDGSLSPDSPNHCFGMGDDPEEAWKCVYEKQQKRKRREDLIRAAISKLTDDELCALGCTHEFRDIVHEDRNIRI